MTTIILTQQIQGPAGASGAGALLQSFTSGGTIVFNAAAGAFQPISISASSGLLLFVPVPTVQTQILGPVYDVNGTWATELVRLTAPPGVWMQTPLGGFVTNTAFQLPGAPAGTPRSSYTWVYDANCTNPGPAFFLL
jgi:hypothetical protein